MSGENRSEQPTQRRRQKAREQGRVAMSAELGGAFAICATVWIVASQFMTGVGAWRQAWWWALESAQADTINPARGAAFAARIGLYWAIPALAACFVISLLTSVGQTGLVFALAQLRPSLERVSPAAKLKQMFSTTNLAALGKSLLPAIAMTYLVSAIFTRDWQFLVHSNALPVQSVGSAIAARTMETAWKCGLVLAAWAGVDFFVKRRKHERDLRMTTQEVREELKESEGNPQVKARIRKLQRQTRRKRMLDDVAKAAVVITNPTSYAIALEYNDKLVAPVVAAKGRNLLAEQIKNAAVWNEVPIIENVPLAHALYRTAEVGQAIPAKLYAAVAEILAFVFRAQARLRDRRGAR